MHAGDLDNYGNVAKLIVTMAEIIALWGKPPDGAVIVESYSQKFNRYRAFRRELDNALKQSNILPPLPKKR